MINITRHPIIIFSTPRVGSTALSRYIKNIAPPDLLYFAEPDHRGDIAIQNFLKIMDSTKKFILKVHLQHIQKYQPNTDYLLYDPEPFRIRIRRRDFIKQAVSLYITTVKNKRRDKEIWNAWKGGTAYDILLQETEPLPYTEAGIIKALQSVHRTTTELNNSDIKFDLDLYFEDIIPLINTTNFVEYPKPKNYQEILDTAYKINEIIQLG
jgi:hypothetical protein